MNTKDWKQNKKEEKIHSISERWLLFNVLFSFNFPFLRSLEHSLHACIFCQCNDAQHPTWQKTGIVYEIYPNSTRFNTGLYIYIYIYMILLIERNTYNLYVLEWCFILRNPQTYLAFHSSPKLANVQPHAYFYQFKCSFHLCQ